jgi:pyruvate-ferredoxin/flavodoxin oxidoreductase
LYIFGANGTTETKAFHANRADALLAKAKAQTERVWKEYKYLAERPF